MLSHQDLYKQAVQYYQTRNLSNAEGILRQILAIDPRHALSLHLLGIIGFDVERYDLAEELVRAAISEQDNNPNFHFTLGRILNRQDKKEDAISHYRQAISLKEDYVDALNNLGTVLLSMDRIDEASDIFSKILQKNHQDFNALSNSASILYKQGRFDEAVEHYKKSLNINSTNPKIYHDIGLALEAQNKIDEALEFFLKATQIKPDYIDALLMIANIYRYQGKLDDSLSYYLKIKSLEKNEYASVGAAFVYTEQGRHEFALMEVEYADRTFPESFQLKNFLGTVYNRVLLFEEALQSFDRAIELDPNQVEGYANRATTLKNLGRTDEAIAALKKCLSMDPSLAWIYHNLLLTMIYASSVSPEELAKTCREFGDKIADPKLRERPFTNDRSTNRRLRIGYVSPDFRSHAVRYFLSPIYEHDSEKFELFAYSKTEMQDNVTEMIKKHFDHWRDIKYLNSDDAADLIEKDKIDILVDPAGHTANNGLMIFARKPAPIQITWLGYTATTGMKAMDYRITDPYAEPVGMTEHLNTETLWRLPDIFAAYSPHEDSPSVVDKAPFEGNGYITFGCLNNFTKITDTVIQTWTKILKNTPNSKLLLEISGIDNEKIRSEIEERLLQYGLEKNQLILFPFKKSNQYVLYNKIDIALDPYPAVGGTTSMDTLWMGVPFVTLAGRHFASRMGVSILTNAGLPELIAQNTEEYISIAVDLAKNPDRLRQIRHGLRERFAASPAMDQKKFARNMEAAFQEMWKIWVSKN